MIEQNASGTATVVFEETYTLDATPAALWSAWTERPALEAWFCERADLVLRVGGWFRFWGRYTPHVPDEPDARQSIEDLEPGRRLAFAWTWMGAATRVSMEIESAGGGRSTLRLRHESAGVFDRHDPGDSAYVLLDFWSLSIANLEGYLRDGAAVLRCEHCTDGAAMEGDAEVSVEIEAPAEIVWGTLTEPARIERWMGVEAAPGGSAGVRVGSGVGGVYSFGWTKDGEAIGPTRILEWAPGRRLVHDWTYPSSASTRTAWTIEPLGDDRCRLTVRQIGVGDAFERSDYTNGWAKFLLDLRVAARSGALHGEGA